MMILNTSQLTRHYSWKCPSRLPVLPCHQQSQHWLQYKLILLLYQERFQSGPRFNIKMSSYQYRKSHYDRLISTMGFPILVRWHLHIESGPCVFSVLKMPIGKKVCFLCFPWKNSSHQVLISPGAHGDWTWFLHKTRASFSSGSKLSGMAFKKWNLKHILSWKDLTFKWWYYISVCSCLSDRLPKHHWFKWWTTIYDLKIQMFRSLRLRDHLDLPYIGFLLDNVIHRLGLRCETLVFWS